MDKRALELLEHGMRDMYDAEQRFVRSLEKMERNADDPSLAKGFGRHKDVTANQVKRLEQAFTAMGARPAREECAAAKGLVAEYENFYAEHHAGNGFMDTFAATAGLKVEHYEIASYRALVNLAEFCDQDEVAKLLAQNLAEEEQAAAEMEAASMKLGAKLAGASTAKVATRSVAGMFDRGRESTFAAVGGVRAVTSSAADRVKSRASKAKTKAKPKPKARAKSRPKAKARTTSRAKTKPKASAKAKPRTRATASTSRKKKPARRKR